MKEDRAITKPSVLLIKLPPWDINFPPLGIAYLSVYMEKKGIEAKVLDLNLEIYKNVDSSIREAWKNNNYFYWQTDKLANEFEGVVSWVVEKILSFNATVIGFSMTISSRKLFKIIIGRLKAKAPDKVIVLGGPFTAWKEFRNSLDEYKKFVDYFVIGDGELPLYQIMQHVGSGMGNGDIQLNGDFLKWRDDPSDISICIQGPKVLKLDEIPYPTYNGFDMDSYLDKGLISILGSRGCIRKCSFCNDTVMWGKPFRHRSPENIVEEMKYCISKYGTVIFKFDDLMLNGSLNFLSRLSELLIKEDLRARDDVYQHVEWHGQIAVRKDMDLPLFKKMRKSGFKVSNIGVESFSNNVLRLMNKGYTADDAVRFIAYQKEADIETQINIIVGFPGETEKDFKETLDYLHKASPVIDYVGSVSTCGVGPGSELHDNPEKFNIDIKDSFLWYSKDGENDIYVRMRRYKRLLDFLKKENIPILNVSQLASMELFIKEEKKKRGVLKNRRLSLWKNLFKRIKAKQEASRH